MQLPPGNWFAPPGSNRSGGGSIKGWLWENWSELIVWSIGQSALFGDGIPWVISANMGCKLFVAPQLEGAHHFIERCAPGSTNRFKPPATFGATKTPKM